MNVKYLDSNVFLQSALYIGAKTDRAQAILESIAKDESSAATSSLAMDEIVWVAMKEMGDRKKALILCKSILEIPNLKILDVTGGDILKALWFMEKYSKLKPRDAAFMTFRTIMTIHMARHMTEECGNRQMQLIGTWYSITMMGTCGS